jgi:hypothetical protein
MRAAISVVAEEPLAWFSGCVRCPGGVAHGTVLDRAVGRGTVRVTNEFLFGYARVSTNEILQARFHDDD